MKTTLPSNSIVKMRERGNYEFYRLVDGKSPDEKHYTGVGQHLTKGTEIHEVVWKDKGTRLEVRRTYRLKEDCDWVPAVPVQQQCDDVARLCDGLVTVIRRNHCVILSPQRTAVSVPGMSWAWQRSGELVGPTSDELREWTREQFFAFADVVLGEFHQPGSPLACTVCHPPMMNVERKTGRLKK